MHDHLSNQEREILEDVTSDGDYIDQMCSLKSRLDSLKEQVERCEQLMGVVEEKFNYKVDIAYKAAHEISISRIIAIIRKRKVLVFFITILIALIAITWRYDQHQIITFLKERTIQGVTTARSYLILRLPKITFASPS